VAAVLRVTWGKAPESPGLTVRQLGGTTAHRFMGSQVHDLMERDTKVAKHRCAERSFLSRQLFCPDSRHSPLMAGRRIAAGQSFAILTPIRRVTADRSGYPGDIDATKGHASRRLPRRWPTLCVYTTPDHLVMRGTTPATARRSNGKGSPADLTHTLRSFLSL
jgi:hypothetical protein